MNRVRPLGVAALMLLPWTGHSADALDEPPDEALLLYLAEWAQVDGKWLSPQQVEDMPDVTTQTKESKDD